MSSTRSDVRHLVPRLQLYRDHSARTELSARRHRLRVRVLIVLNVILALSYFSWLLDPAHGGTMWLYGLLVVAEVFNLVQAGGFWWTTHGDRAIPESPRWLAAPPPVDVLIPTFNEPVDIVEPTVRAATRMEGARVKVYLLDDGGRPEMAAMATRLGATYVTRTDHSGAKAGNINHALALSNAPFVAVFDCDHVPKPQFLTETLGHLAVRDVAFVQTPQHYSNQGAGPIPAAAAAQQDLFFGVIARGKDANGAMFCCGTNFVFRRQALEDVGYFPVNSLTEDFELSMKIHERGWKSVYVPIVLAEGLGPEDMASYVSQQARWAQGCLSALPRILTNRLPIKLRAQYLLSAMNFLSGWTILVYMALPVLRIFGGIQPLHPGASTQFLEHFVPYFLACVLTVAVASDGKYTFSAYSLAAANFGTYIWASLRVLTRRKGRFVVTPKRGRSERQIRPVLPALVAISILLSAIGYAVLGGGNPGDLTNASFAAIHVGILGSGVLGALLVKPRLAPVEFDVMEEYTVLRSEVAP